MYRVLGGTLVMLAMLCGSLLAQGVTVGMKEGQMHPDFVLPDLDGKAHRLSDCLGRKVLLFHFASW